MIFTLLANIKDGFLTYDYESINKEDDDGLSSGIKKIRRISSKDEEIIS